MTSNCHSDPKRRKKRLELHLDREMRNVLTRPSKSMILPLLRRQPKTNTDKIIERVITIKLAPSFLMTHNGACQQSKATITNLNERQGGIYISDIVWVTWCRNQWWKFKILHSFFHRSFCQFSKHKSDINAMRESTNWFTPTFKRETSHLLAQWMQHSLVAADSGDVHSSPPHSWMVQLILPPFF